jgi:hypothetical protein
MTNISIPRKLIDKYNHAATFTYGRVPLGSPDWIDPSLYFDEYAIIEEWGSWFGENDSIEIDEYSAFLNHVAIYDPYHGDTLILDIDVKQVFGEDEPFKSDEEREEYESDVGIHGGGHREKTIHIEKPIDELSRDELQGLIQQIVKSACER